MRYVWIAFLMFSGIVLGACSAKDSSSTVTITGRVVRNDVTPPVGIQNVQVTATMVNEPANPGEVVPSFPPVVTTTDSAGRFAMDLPLAGVVDDPANPTGLVPAVGLPVSLRFHAVVPKGTECDTTSVPHVLWNIYSEIGLTRTFQLPDAGTLDIGRVDLEEFTEITEFRYGTVGGC